ncbi:MAG: phage head closure protein [Eubacterium coprostanoligenes]|nr:phage head closure protein [Eubacterium coprostanoligenes]
MALGRMDTPITILTTSKVMDEQGFATTKTHPIACVRAYKEDKNTTEKWSNRAMFQDASSLFRIRYIPNKTITTNMQIECYDGTYDITSVENIRGKNMYIEILGKKVVAPNAKGIDETS